MKKAKLKKRPRDPVQLGKLIVDIATGEVEDVWSEAKKPPVSKAVRKWLKDLGKQGGLARAAKLTKAQRLESSRKANEAKQAKRRAT